MTIGELKNSIKDLDDNMIVGGAGWYGEFLECEFAKVRMVEKQRFSDEMIEIFCITLEYPGDEPD